MNADLGPVGKQRIDQHQRRGFANVVRPGFERQPPDANRLVRQPGREILDELAVQDLLLGIVDGVDGFKNLREQLVVFGHAHQRPDVLGEARTAVPDSRKQELESDPLVMADPPPHVVDIGAHLVAEIRHLVDEADFGRQHAVGDILRHFRAFEAHHQKRLLGAQKRLVEIIHLLANICVQHTDHHAIRLRKVVDRAAFLQELGIRADATVATRQLFETLEHLPVCSNRNRAFDDDNRLRIEQRRERIDDLP